MTESDADQKWRERFLWLMARGIVLDTDPRPRGPFGAGAALLEAPEKIDRMLAELKKDYGLCVSQNGKPLEARK